MAESLPFNWQKHYVPDRSVDCFPACISMCALYWGNQFPDLAIPTDKHFWKMNFIDKYKATTPRGSSIKRIYESISALNLKEGIPAGDKSLKLKIETYNPANIRYVKRFLELNPPFPVIIIYDRSLSLTNVEGGYHAVIFHSVDLKKEKISIIDPTLTDLGKPFPLDLDRFNVGWSILQNLVIVVYPRKLPITINTKGVVIDRSMDEFVVKEEQ